MTTLNRHEKIINESHTTRTEHCFPYHQLYCICTFAAYVFARLQPRLQAEALSLSDGCEFALLGGAGLYSSDKMYPKLLQVSTTPITLTCRIVRLE